MPPTVAEAITHGRRGIRELEPQMIRRLLAEYELAWRAVERDIQRLEGNIVQAIASGENVNEAWLRRQVWYRQVQASIDREFVRFGRDALGTIVQAQSGAVSIAGESTALFRQAVGIQTSLSGRVNAGAFERWVSAIQPGSPIRGVIDGYGDRAQQAVLTHMTEGLGSGQGANTIVRNIMRDSGPDAVEGRIATLTRTESMRAFKGASMDQYAALEPGIVIGYRWLSARDTRVCIACLSQDGRTFKTYQMTQHPSCRCICVPIVDPKIVPPGRPREPGADWFERQDEATKRKMMPTNAHYELYQSGVPLSEMTGRKQSRVWGPSTFIKPARSLRV